MSRISYYITKDGKQKIDPFTEDVNGTIIGGFTLPYEFWTRDGKTRLCRGAFENDEQAVAWFKENYPDAFSAGSEMRVFE